MNRDQFFDELFDPTADRVEAIRFQRQLAFEERVIKAAFRDCGIKITSWGRLVNLCKAATGHPKLNFNWFNGEYRFPARLLGYRIPKLHELTLWDLFRPATSNRLCRALQRRFDAQQVDPTYGFAFFFPVRRKLFCAHNLNELEPLPGVRLPRWTIPSEAGILSVELADSFFQAIGSDWFEG